MGVMTGPDDAALARAAQAGDAASMGVLFERHRARLHAVAVGMLGHGSDAEDCVQDTIVIAMRRIGELREPAAVGGWLVAIVVNVCRAQLRRPTRELPGADAAELRGALDTVRGDRGARRAARLGLDGVGAPARASAGRRHAAPLLDRQLVLRDRRHLRRSGRDRAQPPQRGPSRLADELLPTATAAHTDGDTVRAWSLAAGAALLAFQRSGDAALLESVFSPRRRVPDGRPRRAPRPHRPRHRAGARLRRRRHRAPAARHPRRARRDHRARCSRARPSSRCTAHPPSPRSTSTTPAAPTGSSPTTRHARGERVEGIPRRIPPDPLWRGHRASFERGPAHRGEGFPLRDALAPADGTPKPAP